MNAKQAIRRAEAILPGRPAQEGEEDQRWQAIIEVGEFIQSDPLSVWGFASKWGRHSNEDLRTAIATCLLEHLLEYHFELIFPRVQKAAQENKRFADTFSRCWKFGQATEAKNASRWDRLEHKCRPKL